MQVVSPRSKNCRHKYSVIHRTPFPPRAPVPSLCSCSALLLTSCDGLVRLLLGGDPNGAIQPLLRLIQYQKTHSLPMTIDDVCFSSRCRRSGPTGSHSQSTPLCREVEFGAHQSTQFNLEEPLSTHEQHHTRVVILTIVYQRHCFTLHSYRLQVL